MNIHYQQPFYQEDFSSHNYYYDQNQHPHLSSPVPNYHPNAQYINSPGDSVAEDAAYLPPTYWSPDEDDKSLSSNPSSVGEAFIRPGHSYPGHGFSPESVVHNHIKNEIMATSCLQPVSGSNGCGVAGGGGGGVVTSKKNSKGQQQNVVGAIPSKRKGVGGRRKSEKPPPPVVLKKRRLAANAR